MTTTEWAESVDRFGPTLVVLLTGGVILFANLVVRRPAFLTAGALAGLALSAAYSGSFIARDERGPAFAGTFSLDNFTLFFNFLFTGVAALVLLSSTEFSARFRSRAGEYHGLLLIATAGMMLMASTTDLIALYVSLEMTSISLYTLVALLRDEHATEAGLKYLLLGAVSSAVVLFGMAYLFGITGTTGLAGIAEGVAAMDPDLRFALILAVTFLAAGFAFKMAVIPFQMWTPDVYQGAPTPVAAFLSVGSKAAGFAMVLRVFYAALPDQLISADWSNLFAGVAAASMTLGNAVALTQTNIKRLLGYSSIAQAGNFLVGVAAISAAEGDFRFGASSTVFFLATYVFTNLAAFIAVIAISDRIGSDEIADYGGMGRRAPLLALALAVALVSLTGLPPTAGFVAKVYIFNAAAQADLWWLVVIGVLNSVVSAYYYLRLVSHMYLAPAPSRERLLISPPLGLALGVTVAGALAFGIVPSPLISLAQDAASIFV